MKKIILILLYIPFSLFAQEKIQMPIFPNCEESESIKDCFTKNIAKQLVKNTEYTISNAEKSESSNIIEKIKIQCLFTINTHGQTEKIQIKGKIKRKIRNKFKSNLENLPILKPGTKNDEPINLTFNLPVQINFIE